MQTLLLISFWLYFIGEGVTESQTTQADWISTYRIDWKRYHLWRVLENLGIVGIILISHYCGISNWLYGSLTAMVSGLVVYEWAFKIERRGNPFYTKSSKWFGLPHPTFMVELYIFVTALAGTIALWW